MTVVVDASVVVAALVDSGPTLDERLARSARRLCAVPTPTGSDWAVALLTPRAARP